MSTVQFKDYYEVLGIDRNADAKAIQSAFRKRAREVHPDVNKDNPNAEEAFKDVNEAYEVLSDPEKRKMYDRFGQDWSRYRDAGYSADQATSTRGGGTTYTTQDFGEWFAGSGSETFTTSDSNGRFSDFFNLLFGAQGGPASRVRRPSRPARGEDSELTTTVTLEEAYRGGIRHVNVQVPAECPTCHGTGEARGAMCPRCDGSGTIRQSKTLEVKIPAGVKTGSRVRVAGQGGPGVSGGPSGDVYLVIKVVADPRFELKGSDLEATINVPLYTAVLGGEVVVPTITGKVALNIPEGTQTGRTFRLRGKGMPVLGQAGTFGDLRVKTTVQIPTSLSDEERALFEELRTLGKGKA